MWRQKGLVDIPRAVVNNFIKTVLLEGRHGSKNRHEVEGYTFQWLQDNNLSLVYLAVYQKILGPQLTYIPRLLHACKDEYTKTLGIKSALNNNESGSGSAVELSCLGADGLGVKFADSFKILYQNLEEQSREELKEMSTYENSLKAKKNMQTHMTTNQSSAVDNSSANSSSLMSTKPKFQRKTFRKKDKDGDANKNSGKTQRQWGLNEKGKGASELDFSAKQQDEFDQDVDSKALKEEMDVDKIVRSTNVHGGMSLKDIGNIEDYDNSDSEIDDEDAAGDKRGSSSSIFSYFNSLLGNQTIHESNIEPVIRNIKEHLISKNVASGIAEDICKGISKDLIGVEATTFKSIKMLVHNAMKSTLTRILMPRRRVDILGDIAFHQKSSQEKPYVIAMCGVNGVGKSTNLSKICFWLMQNNKKILIAACDTFRAGAVEQLSVHQKALTRLNSSTGNEGGMVRLYEKGYGKDAAGIASEAIAYATKNGYDVVMIDTAGRMQDNEPLMRSLAKLVRVNTPDLVLFVGEALVGNEAVDQLYKFNQALVNHSHGDKKMVIDGVVLSKFDTIDDKVGAAISMTYTTGQPIVFVGTGQTYTDLKRLNVDSVVKSLLR